MGKINFKYSFTLVLIWLMGCIGTDLEPEVTPIIRLTNLPENFHVTGVYTLEASYMNERGMEEDVTFIWSSSDATVFSIDQNGIGRALKEGIVDLSVQYEDRKEEISITVFSSQESIRIVEAPDSLSVGETFTLRAEYTDLTGIVKQPDLPITWSVAESSVAEIDENGTIRGLWVGVADVKATVGAFSDSVSFEINRAETVFDEELRIVVLTQSMELGTQFQFEAQYFDSSGEVDNTVFADWASSAPEIISINQNGLARALTEGSATISALTNGKTTSVEVTAFSENTNMVRSGSLEGRGYRISGNFTLAQDGDQLILSFENASIDPNAPGPYFYLSNQERSVTGGVNLGKSEDGTFSINVTEVSPETTIDSYDYVIVWCEPFNVTLGLGSLSN
ncbi:MAG: Ig-like domain-containing protein [Cytophagales bacterium]|nr:Ig-like domain-containing protein [Cytophagales bacterium]